MVSKALKAQQTGNISSPLKSYQVLLSDCCPKTLQVFKMIAQVLFQ